MSAVAALDEYLDGLLVDRPPPAPARAPTAVVALAGPLQAPQVGKVSDFSPIGPLPDKGSALSARRRRSCTASTSSSQ